jgi:hypothetical protein
MNAPIPFPICAESELIPMPIISPVKNLKILLLSLLQKACVKPSMKAGTIKKNVMARLKKIKLKINSGMKRNERFTPVHLAQNGNCFPLKKKDRPGNL